MKIPTIIHQTCMDREIPESRTVDFSSWRKHHPDWNFIFWDDSSLAEFVATEFPQYLERYQSHHHQIERVHTARYFILKKFGGVFVDLDLG